MITYKDIRLAVNRKLKTTGIEINSEDVSEGFNRPSFFVEFLNNNRSGDENQVHKALSVQIYYFPTDRYEYSIEVMDMQERLENIFDLKLRVLDRLFNVDETNAITTDGVLNFSFDIAFYDARAVPYGVVIIPVDEEGNPVDEVPVDEEGNPIDEGITPVEVPIDEDGNPITDNTGKPMPIELMEILDIENTKE